MAKPIAAERQQQILEVLQQQHSVKIIELAEMFQVSKETIRRDLNALEERGCLQKSYGGAIAAPKYEFNTVSLESRIHKNQNIKMKLCERALAFLPEKAVIFVDTGSTMHCLSELLMHRTGYTILTNSLDAANVLIHSRNRTVLTGGELNEETMATDGFQTIEFLNKIKVDFAFLGTNGFEQHHGPAGTDFLDAQTKQTIIKNSKETIVVSDSRKATYSALIQYASWRDIDHFITDSRLPESFQTSLAELTDVILVDV